MSYGGICGSESAITFFPFHSSKQWKQQGIFQFNQQRERQKGKDASETSGARIKWPRSPPQRAKVARAPLASKQAGRSGSRVAAQEGPSRSAGTCPHGEHSVDAAKDQHVLQTCRQSERHITQGDASMCVQPSWRDGQGSFNIAGGAALCHVVPAINKTAQCTAQEGASSYVGTCLDDDAEHLASTDEPQRVACTLSKVACCAPQEGTHERVGTSRHSTHSLKGL